MDREKEEVLKMFTEAWDRFMTKGGSTGRGSHRRRNRVADVQQQQQQGAPDQWHKTSSEHFNFYSKGALVL